METKYKIITNKQELKKLIQCIKQTCYASVDFETNAEPIYNKSFKPTILSVTFQPGFGCSIPLDHFDCIKDRLAAYYHWDDEQSLQQAVWVAEQNDYDLVSIKEWSLKEGADEKFANFVKQLNIKI